MARPVGNLNDQRAGKGLTHRAVLGVSLNHDDGGGVGLVGNADVGTATATGRAGGREQGDARR